jgi:hypothetical protein
MAPGSAPGSPGAQAAPIDPPLDPPRSVQAGATSPLAATPTKPRDGDHAAMAAIEAPAASTSSAPEQPRPGTPPFPVNGRANGHAQVNGNGQDRSTGCTAPQLRRFIKSRPYVPMHELRRRFAIDGGDDEVTQVSINQGHVYVGLPSREGSLLGELLRGGDIGYELSLDPRTPVVIGVYPMRPVPRS